MVRQKSSADFPSEVDLDPELFHRHKKGWLYWHALGRYDSNDKFEPPVTFEESKRMPKDELDTYLELDRLYSIRRAQVLKETKP